MANFADQNRRNTRTDSEERVAPDGYINQYVPSSSEAGRSKLQKQQIALYADNPVHQDILEVLNAAAKSADPEAAMATANEWIRNMIIVDARLNTSKNKSKERPALKVDKPSFG